MGYDRDTSPNIDKLAANSLVFTNAYSQSGFTLSSHKSILSGFSTKLFDYYSNSPISHKKKLTGEVPLLQHYLKEAGYYTVAFTGGAFMGSKFGFSSGFDSFTARKEGFNIKGKGTAKGKISGFDNPLAWLDQNGRTGPYFMLLHTYATHGPYAPPRSYNKYFGKSSSELFNNTISIPKLEKFSLDPSLYLDGDLEQVIRVYDRGIRWVDDSVGKLIQKLEALGTLDNTVIILLSDHGDEFLEHGRFGHRTMWDAQLHVPLIIHIPKTKGNPRLVETNVELINVTPTILDILGIESPIQMQGESLLKFAVNEPTDDIGRPVFSSQDSSRDQTLDNNKRSKVGFVTCKFKGYKYHFLFNKQENWVGDRLFNISNDPVETDDLVISGMSKKEKVMLEELRTRALVYMANSTPGYNILVSSDIEPVKVRVRASDTRANKKLKALGRSWKLTNQKQSLVLNQISAKGMNRGLVMLAEDYVLEDAKLVITNADNIALGLSSMANTDSPIYLDSVPEYFGTPTNLMELVLEAIRRNSVVIWKTVHSFKNVDVGESVISKETINELKNLGYVQ
jgi:arylsulfatase A-like enzyme